MQAEGKKLPVFNASEALDVGLPEDTKEKVQEWVEGEQERVRQKEEDRRTVGEMAVALEQQGMDTSSLRYFGEQ